MLQTVLLIGLGGFLGSISRFFFGQWVKQIVFLPFPISPLLINAIGSLLIGFAMSAFKTNNLFPQVILFFVIGFLGAFTTFSTFSFETLELYKKGLTNLALLNIASSLVLCLVFVFIGDYLGQIFEW